MNANIFGTIPGRSPWLFLAVYGGIHALVDATCVMTVFSGLQRHGVAPQSAFYCVIFYDLLAFAGQVPLGWLCDRLRAEKGTTLAGILLPLGAILSFQHFPFASMILAGVGNAAYHVGAGSVSLNLDSGKATPPGLFVAPGALGLGLGLFLGRAGSLTIWPFAMLLLASAIFTALYDMPRANYHRPEQKSPIPFSGIIVLLLLLSIAVRALVGFGASYQLPGESFVFWSIVFAACIGKGVGGILSDRFGWIRISVGALLASAPFIALGGDNPYFIVGGLLIFQMTMPVTLVAVSEVLQGRPGLAFGLTCLALISGSLPTFFNEVKAQYSGPLFFILILVAAAWVLVGLRGLVPHISMGGPVLRKRR